MCEYEIRLSSFDSEVSAALLAYELAFDTGDRREILRTWRVHCDAQDSRNRFIEVTQQRARVAA